MVHTYQNNNYNIIIDGNSGTVHNVDEIAYYCIKWLSEGKSREKISQQLLSKYSDTEKITPKDIEELFEDIDELINQGKLFSEDIFQKHASEFKDRQSVLKAICLHVAHDCNLACKYCFAGEGEYKTGTRNIMSLETGKKALDFLVENSQNRKNLEVDFFGGEPLLNWEVCKELVYYGNKLGKKHNKNFRFTLTTNGILLNDEVIEFSNKHMSNVVLSLDGRKEINDKMRVFRNDLGSYDLILPNFLKLAKKRNQKDYYVRGTYTKYNKDFSKDLIHMADLGFQELSIEPVVTDDSLPYALTEEDLPELFAEYDKLALEMIKRRKEGKPFNFYHYTVDLESGPCIVKRISGCGVGTEYMAVTPEGDLYPCHQFVGDDEYKIGNVFTGIKKQSILDEFKSCNVYSHDECHDCFAKMYCSGGCAANAYHSTGSISGVYSLGCELHKKRIECAIMMEIDKRFSEA